MEFANKEDKIQSLQLARLKKDTCNKTKIIKRGTDNKLHYSKYSNHLQSIRTTKNDVLKPLRLFSIKQKLNEVSIHRAGPVSKFAKTTIHRASPVSNKNDYTQDRPCVKHRAESIS